jgi:hypothetical protein
VAVGAAAADCKTVLFGRAPARASLAFSGAVEGRQDEKMKKAQQRRTLVYSVYHPTVPKWKPWLNCCFLPIEASSVSIDLIGIALQ